MVMGVVYCVVYLSASEMLRRRRISKLYARQWASPQDFYKAYYSESYLPEGAILKALALIEDATDLPVGRLHPEDRLDGEYFTSPLEFESDIDCFILDLAVRSRGCTKDTAEEALTKLETVDDLIRAIIFIDHGLQ